MIQKVKKFIEDNIQINNKDIILVALSGGPDSVALLDILEKLKFKIVCAHCNFMLRDKESTSDEIFVRELCNKKNIPLFVKVFETQKYASENKISIEMSARDLRYDWFKRLSKQHNCKYIAVGHHQNDSVETLLINITRGTGIKGLTGLNFLNGNIIRPLLCVDRKEIDEYIDLNGLRFRIDRTNNESIYVRNKIRLDIIPEFEKLNPNFKNSVIQTITNLNEVKKIYNYFIEKEKKTVFIDNKIDIQKLANSPSPESLLFEILYPFAFSKSTIYDIINSLDALSGKIFLSVNENYSLLKDRDYLILRCNNYPKNINELPFKIASNQASVNTRIIKMKIEHLKVGEIKSLKTESNILLVDLDKLEFPLYIRKWEKGNWFCPLGLMGKKQKLSDYFNNSKMSLFEKDETLLLTTSKNDIVWIIGRRLDERFKVDGNTINVVKFTIL